LINNNYGQKDDFHVIVALNTWLRLTESSWSSNLYLR